MNEYDEIFAEDVWEDIEEDDYDDEMFDDDDEDYDDDEAYDDYDDDDDAERRVFRRRKYRRKPRVARGRNFFRPRLAKRTVSQKQLHGTLKKVGNDIRRNAKAIKGINSKINKINTRQDRKLSALDKRNQGSNQTSMLLPMLMKFQTPKTLKFTEAVKVTDDKGNTVIPANTELKIESQSVQQKTDDLLPLLLLGMGNSGSSDRNNMMLPLVLLMNKDDNDNDDKDDNTALLIAMMMMNQK